MANFNQLKQPDAMMTELTFAPEVAALPLHSDEELKELTQSIKEHGFKAEFPIIVFSNEIYDGRNRYNAAINAGVEPAIKYCYCKEEALKLAEMSYLQRVYTVDQKLMVKAHFASIKSGSNQHKIVKSVANSEANKHEVSAADVAEQSGVSVSKALKAVSIKNATEDGALSATFTNQVIAGAESVNSCYETKLYIDKAARRKAGTDDEHVIAKMTHAMSNDVVDQATKTGASLLQSAKTMYPEPKKILNGHTIGDNDSEWYTPVHITDTARRVMGSIDTDPASNEYAQNRIMAKVYYTEETNGLDKEWHGNVWLNPPYGKSTKDKVGCSDFIDKLLEECESGHAKQYLVLVNTSNGTGWYERMSNHCMAMGLSRRRIQFDKHPDHVDDDGDNNTKGQTLFYWNESEEIDLFHMEFADLFNTFVPMTTSVA